MKDVCSGSAFVRKWRTDANLTQKELAVAIYGSPSNCVSVSQMENQTGILRVSSKEHAMLTSKGCILPSGCFQVYQSRMHVNRKHSAKSVAYMPVKEMATLAKELIENAIKAISKVDEHYLALSMQQDTIAKEMQLLEEQQLALSKKKLELKDKLNLISTATN